MPQERILVVDDEPSVRGVLASILERSGYTVATATTATTANEALTSLQEHQGFDLVLADIMMPGIDGLILLGTLDHLVSQTLPSAR